MAKSMTYKELFFRKYANSRGNIKKGTKAIDVWNSIEEFLRIVLEPKPKASKRKTIKVNNDRIIGVQDETNKDTTKV